MQKIPSPGEVGLPPKFDTWRPAQEEMIRVMITDETRNTVISAPTGSGKSPAYIAAAILTGKPTCIVTNSKGLQDQLMTDFSCIGLVDIRGRNNYKCGLRPDDHEYSCEEGHAARCLYKGSVSCPASKAEFKASASKLVVTNYDKWIASRRMGRGMDHFQQVIFDEGHYAPEALAKECRVELNHREIEETLNIKFLTGETAESYLNWKEWANIAHILAQSAYIKASARLVGTDNVKASWIKHMLHMRNLCRRLALLRTADPVNWVPEQFKYGWQFDPIYPGKYAEHMLLMNTPRVIVVSATVRPKSMYMIGQAKTTFTFHEYDSSFDPARCPIYYLPVMRVEWKQDLAPLWFKLDQFISQRRGLRGIVHTVSFDRQMEVIASSRFSEHMMFNKRGDPATKAVEDFKTSDPGTILISPSVGTGYDFPGDECRWQFLCKIPFEPPSKILKARQAADKEYSGFKAIQTLEQQCGRDMRSPEDWSERLICDEHMEWFLPRYGHLATKSFHRFMKRIKVLPKPLRFK